MTLPLCTHPGTKLNHQLILHLLQNSANGSSNADLMVPSTLDTPFVVEEPPLCCTVESPGTILGFKESISE